jgi:NADH-ubiquinone oxidoreductase chain 2
MLFISILILIMVMAIPSLKDKIHPIIFQRMSTIILIYAGALSLNALYIQSIGSGIGIYSGLFHVTFISQLLEIFIYIIGAAILIARPVVLLAPLTLSSQEQNKNISVILENNYKNTIEYSLVVIFSTLGASLLISSSNLISMYLSTELQSFAVYILPTLYKDSELATNAGLKYFLLGSLASCFILLGSGLIYTYTGLTNLESIYNFISVTESVSLTSPIANSNISQGIALGFIIIFVGYLLKVSAAPLHNWAPDVYDESPTIVTIWLTIMPKISILILLLEIFTQITSVNPILESLGLNTIRFLLLITSLFSLIIGTVVGLAQIKIKRLLAYSTISHIGFILLALSINSVQSIDSFIFYIIQYTLTNLNTFLILIAIGYILNNNILINKGSVCSAPKDINYISELKGLFFTNPILSISLTICLLSMAGTPPFLGFFSKQFVLYSAIESGYYFMSIAGILVSIISASYYLRIIRILHTSLASSQSESQTYKNKDAKGQVEISNTHSLIISILTLLILFFILKPSILLKSTQLLSLTIFST